MTRIEMNRGWKIFGSAVLLIIVAVGLFFATTAIIAHFQNIEFVEYLKQLFGIAKEVVEELPSEDVDSAFNVFNSIL